MLHWVTEDSLNVSWDYKEAVASEALLGGRGKKKSAILTTCQQRETQPQEN